MEGVRCLRAWQTIQSNQRERDYVHYSVLASTNLWLLSGNRGLDEVSSVCFPIVDNDETPFVLIVVNTEHYKHLLLIRLRHWLQKPAPREPPNSFLGQPLHTSKASSRHFSQKHEKRRCCLDTESWHDASYD